MTMLVKDAFAKIKRIVGLTTLLTVADDNLIVTSADMKVGTLTIAAQPGTPSLLSFKMTNGGNADTPGIATVVGTNGKGKAQTEAVTLVANSTVWSTKYFKTVTAITLSGWVVSADTTKDTIIVGVAAESGQLISGDPITFMCVSGNIWVNPLTTAVADATALKLTAGQAIDLVVMDVLSLISDASGATYQIVEWDQ